MTWQYDIFNTYRHFQVNVYTHPPPLFSKLPANPYNSDIVASLYDRPEILYSTIVEKYREKLPKNNNFKLALDIGCGTGISSFALKTMAEKIIGIDASLHMLKQAISDEQIDYLHASSEDIPFQDNYFDLLTVFVAFHFFDKKKFLLEAARVLKDDGKMFIAYTHFIGIQTDQYKDWLKNSFYKKYPPTPVIRSAFPKEFLDDSFPALDEQSFPITTPVNLEDMVNLLMTMSGPCEELKKFKSTANEIKEWLTKELKNFFSERDALDFHWNISIWSLNRAPRLQLTNLSENKMGFSAKL